MVISYSSWYSIVTTHLIPGAVLAKAPKLLLYPPILTHAPPESPLLAFIFRSHYSPPST
jgi:hypothetical protein